MTEPEALKWVAEIFDVAPEAITAAVPHDAIAAWDSLGALILIADLDEKFDIVLADADIPAMRTVGDILEILRRNGKLT